MPSKKETTSLSRIRIDKWLWAARFYKTRAIAKQAIDGGKVHINGNRPKPSKEVEPGEKIRLRQGFDEKTVIVNALSNQRLGAKDAQELYQETEESIEDREKLSQQRKAQPKHWASPEKPNKKQRRQIQQFKQQS